MPTFYESVTIAAGEATSEPFQLGPRDRLVGIIVVGDEWTSADIGVDIRPNVDGEVFHSVRDGKDGGRAKVVGVTPGSFHTVNDFNHPLSDLCDDQIRLISVSSDEVDVPQDGERKLLVCIAKDN